MKYSDFRKIPNGQRIFNHGYDQCVALANHYHENVLGKGFVAVASAYQWWTMYPHLHELNSTYVRSKTPVPGALFVAFGGIYDGRDGHIGLVTDVRAGGFSTMEQNTGPYAPQRYTYRHFRVNDSSVLGFLVPRNNPALPKPTPTIRKKKNMLMCYYANAGGPGVPRWAVFGPGFWLEIVTQKAANNLAAQLGFSAFKTDEGGWKKYKAAAQAGMPK